MAKQETIPTHPAFVGHGLTKREYFAALAMQGMLSNGTFEMVNKEITEKAIAISDALIEELNK